MKSPRTRRELQRQVADLTTRLREAEEALAAIRDGEVDAIVVSGRRGTQVFSLAGVDTVYRLIVESMQEAALTAAPDGRILFCNQQFSEMLELPLSTLLGRKLADLMAVEDHPTLASLLRAAKSRPVKKLVRFHGRRGTIPAHVSASFLPQQDGPSICIVAADLSELQASDAELRRSNAELQVKAAQLRRLTAELARAEHSERQRLAAILHDGLQQLLVGAQLQMGRVTAESGKRVGSSSRRVAELLDESIEMSRSLALEISPPIRAGAGLVAAFTWLARWMAAKYALKVKVTAKGKVGPAGEEATILLFRTVQELLLNVVKHAGVKSATLRLEEVRDHLRIRVSDKGCGFDPEKGGRVQRVRGFGLFSIHERLSLVGGNLDIRSKPGTGSSFTLVVPLASVRPESGGLVKGSRRKRQGGDTSPFPR